MITLAKYNLEDIMPYIGHGKPKIALLASGKEYKVKVSSDRLECFRRNHKCVTCNCIGSVFLLQSHVIGSRRWQLNCLIDNCEWCAIYQDRNQQPGMIDTPHLNMYHVGPRGGLVLMTRDHIVPKCKGGPDKIDNLQTMCTICNNHKGAYSFEEFADNGFKKMDRKKAILA
jgi:5-methylcytosine-specific restriction endonuclease McrA